MHRRIILYHDGQDHRHGGQPSVGRVAYDKVHVGRGERIEHHYRRDEPKRQVVYAPEAPPYEDVRYQVGQVGAVSAARSVEVIGDVKQAGYDYPRRIHPEIALSEESLRRRILSPRVPKADAAEEEEHVDSDVAAAHEAVHYVALGHPYVEEHDEEHRQSHQFAAVAAYVCKLDRSFHRRSLGFGM